ncbi:MAG TPA: DUF4199 domain-containing protein [Chitinophagaceae bacterium]|nr:DUF4199 domain-containing protein [Chitinophagaceae bacterium]
MKKTVLVFGLILGAFLIAMMIYSTTQCCRNPERESNDVAGYAAMIIAFSFIFIGIKNFRDKYNGGLIGFGKALKVGALISLVASTLYVVVWLFDYYLFIPDFMDKYAQHVLYEARTGGASQLQLDKKAAEMANYKQLYKNPLFVVLITYVEVLPIGLVVSLISSLILKRVKLKKVN